MKRAIFAAIVLAGAAWSWGQEVSTAPVAGQSPERYVVIKGDSLWTIAEMLYSDGYQWPAIHELNKNTVRDPNFILPQQTLILPGPALKKEVKAASAPAEKKEPVVETPEAGAASQQPPEPLAAASQETQEAAKEVAVEVIPPQEPVAAQPVMTPQPEPQAPSRTPAPKKEFTDYEGTILTGRDPEMSMMSQGDKVYINLGTKDGLMAGDEFLIIRKTKKVLNPATKKKYWLYDRLGKLRITDEIYERRAEGEILFSHEAVQSGDGLIRATQ